MKHPIFKAIAEARMALYQIGMDGMDMPAMGWTVKTKAAWVRLLFELIKEAGIKEDQIYNFPSHTFTIMGIKFTLTSQERIVSREEYIRVPFVGDIPPEFDGPPTEIMVMTAMLRNADWQPEPRIMHADEALNHDPDYLGRGVGKRPR